MKEVWRDIEGYEGLYQVSNLGRVKSFAKKGNWKEKILIQSKTRDGYNIVGLYKNSKNTTVRVHRVVAKAFIPNPNSFLEVNHKDGNKNNNAVDNLEWCTCEENMKHSWNIGLRRTKDILSNLHEYANKGGRNPSSRPVIQYDLYNNYIAEYSGIREAERKTGIGSSNICQCCKGNIKRTGTYVWKYKEVV